MPSGDSSGDNSAMRALSSVGLTALLLLAGCGALPSASSRAEKAPIEAFDATDRFTRTVAQPPARACQAARMALLSQGYLVSNMQNDELRGRKNFQPKPDSHAEVEIHVVCAGSPDGGGAATVFVSALQEHYELKKSANSASVGVPALASLSLPFSLGTDSMVKTASETIESERFYDRFFEVLERYLGSPTALPSDQLAGHPDNDAP
jgi:hypothetical protein